MDNWDLQAEVRGYSDDAFNFALENPSSVFDPVSIQQENLLNCPKTFITNTSVLDELEGLPMPYYPHLNPLSTQTVITSSLSVPQDVEEPEKWESQQSPFQSTVAAKSRKRLVSSYMYELLSFEIESWDFESFTSFLQEESAE